MPNKSKPKVKAISKESSIVKENHLLTKHKQDQKKNDFE